MRYRDLCQLTGIEKTTMSKIVNGEYPGTPIQQKAIAKALRRSVEELFPPAEAWA